MTFRPNLTILLPAQTKLWPELDAIPDHFTLYGGTALALRLGHRNSVDFDFFSNQPFDPEELGKAISFLRGAEKVQVAPNTLKCRVERDGPVLVSFFGMLGLGQAAPRDRAQGSAVHVASLLDIAGTKVAVVQRRAEAKDYFDICALLQYGIALPTALAAGRIVYGRGFNPMISLKVLSFFDDVPTLPPEARMFLSAVVKSVDPANLPVLTPYAVRPDEKGPAP
jgi:hypothetical protein